MRAGRDQADLPGGDGIAERTDPGHADLGGERARKGLRHQRAAAAVVDEGAQRLEAGGVEAHVAHHAVGADPAEMDDLVAEAVTVLEQPEERVRTGVMPVPSAEWDALRERLGDPAVEPSTPFLRWREESIEPVDVLTAIGGILKDDDTGDWRTSSENLLLSDRDDAEVVRQQRRRGQRHALWVLAGIAVLAFGVWSLVSSLTPA